MTPAQQNMANFFDRRSWLIGLMFRHFPHLREDQISSYSIKEMENLLANKGVN